MGETAVQMEPPECPVCLQPYEFAGSLVPRVLPCGHSVCESCLLLLPRHPATPSAVRCPACNYLVRLPDFGPSALPKNIDLLGFCSTDSRSVGRSQKPNPIYKPNPTPFLRLPWTEGLYGKWKDLLLPEESLSLVSFEDGSGASTAFFSSSHEKNRMVNLLPLDALTSCGTSSSWIRPSYVARFMDSLHRMGEERRNRLRLLLDASSRQRRGISRVYGFWMGPPEERNCLFMVCERFDRVVFDILNEERKMDKMFTLAMMGLDMCEAVIGLHSESIVCGCLFPDCFVLDEYGHCILDICKLLVSGRRIRFGGASSDSALCMSPEVYISLLSCSIASDCRFDNCLSFETDVWSLACIMAMILLGDSMVGTELFQGFGSFSAVGGKGNWSELLLDYYEVWKEKLASKIESLLLETELESLFLPLKSCLSYRPQNRPQVKDIWCCIRSFLTKTQVAPFISLEALEIKGNSVSCAIIGDPCFLLHEVNTVNVETKFYGNSVDNSNLVSLGSGTDALESSNQEKVDGSLTEMLDIDGLKSFSLDGHLDCVTALAVGGGYLYSASFDKTVKVWSLQDFSLAQTLKGHEHKIMAMVVVDEALKLCITGDSGSGISVWHIGSSASHELLKNWYEHNDWRYSGIHSLAVSGTSYLYSGGGDKSVKAWSLQDYSLSCVMTGHKSTVSSLALSDGVLYSGSWDGTIRLWSLSDHSLLSELEDTTTFSPCPVLSLSIDQNLVISSYENGFIKVWKNDMFVASMQLQEGAIFGLHADSSWIYAGGWDMIVTILETFEDDLQVEVRPVASAKFDSVVTCLLHHCGKVFVGVSNKIQVLYSRSV
ncbi:hypothetical protein HPP92_013748 [Vanilla planifolia]|uniref:Uncharacterized protein n=1 Tax=Vanilla planifolia TaxID=51239 RepID=A0A835R002_VANPL|nr:hypothetical protein HPP92_013748 [Vanilla planifolia]